MACRIWQLARVRAPPGRARPEAFEETERRLTRSELRLNDPLAELGRERQGLLRSSPIASALVCETVLVAEVEVRFLALGAHAALQLLELEERGF